MKKKKQKKLLLLASVLALVALIAGTFAWLTAQDQRVNRLESLAISDGSVQVNEEFDPTPIQAGGSATKKVSITNGGSAPVYVRVSFEEVLKYLAKGAEETGRNQKWTLDSTNDATKEGVGVDVPTLVNPDITTGKYAGWTDITAKVKDTSNAALGTGLKVIAKGSYKVNAATGHPVKAFDHMIYTELGNGKFQKTSGSLVIEEQSYGDGSTETTEQDWTYKLDLSTLQYHVYESGYKFNVVNWAEGIIPGQKGDGTATDPDAITGTALLGAKGARYGNPFDYRNQTATGIIPDAVLTSGAPAHKLTGTAYPDGTAARTQLPVQSDSDTVLGNKISIKYAAANIVDNTGLADGKWVYNPEDGWFYFTSPLGTGKTTPDLMESIEYDAKIDKEYSNATYDLVVKMEAMQYINEALEGNQGFNLAHQSTVSTAIANQMKAAPIF